VAHVGATVAKPDAAFFSMAVTAAKKEAASGMVTNSLD